MARPKRNRIRKSLKAQMESKGMVGAHFQDLAEDYLALYDRKQELIADLEQRGSVVDTYSASGEKVRKTNPSVIDLLKVNKAMNDMLKNLGLNEPDGAADDDSL